MRNKETALPEYDPSKLLGLRIVHCKREHKAIYGTRGIIIEANNEEFHVQYDNGTIKKYKRSALHIQGHYFQRPRWQGGMILWKGYLVSEQLIDQYKLAISNQRLLQTFIYTPLSKEDPTKRFNYLFSPQFFIGEGLWLQE